MALPPRLRRGVVCAALLAIVLACNHFCRDAPGTIEEQLRADPSLDVTPTRFSIMTALYFAPSALVPLVAGGVSSLPKHHAAYVSPQRAFATVAAVGAAGNVLSAAGASSGSFAALACGRAVAGSVYEAIDMTPLGFVPALLPGLWGTASGFINGALRLGSVLAFAALPRIYEQSGGGADGGGGVAAVFWFAACVGVVMWPLAAIVREVATRAAFDASPHWGGGSLGARLRAWLSDGGDGGDDDDDGGGGAASGGGGGEALKAFESSTGGGGGEAPTPPIASSIATAVAAVVSAVETVPRSFWLYALSGTCMYSAVVPFFFYGGGYLQRRRGRDVAAADELMLLPELALAVLSVPIGVAVDRAKLSFRAQQLGFSVCALMITLAHAALLFGGDEVAAVFFLGVGYACCNQLMWAGFPSVCPSAIASLGAGFIACFINLGSALTPLTIGAMRASMREDAAEDGMFSLFAALSLLAAAGGRALSNGCLGGGTEGTTETGATSGGYVAMEEDEDEERGAAEGAEVPS